MALPPGFTRNGPFVDFDPGAGCTERDIEKFITRPWGEFAAKADAITKTLEDRIAELEARVAKLEAKRRRPRKRKDAHHPHIRVRGLHARDGRGAVNGSG